MVIRYFSRSHVAHDLRKENFNGFIDFVKRGSENGGGRKKKKKNEKRQRERKRKGERKGERERERKQ